MPSHFDSLFGFSTEAVVDAPFLVVSFTGTEALNAPYHFEIILISQTGHVDIEGLLLKNACLSIKRRDKEPIRINGILAEFERRQSFQGYTFYHAVLVPNLWWLVLTHHNQVFLNKNIEEFLTDVLMDAGMQKTFDFEFRLQKQYEPWEFVCQYGESHYQFFSRWLEQYGMAYFFEQQMDNEVLVISDTQSVFTELEEENVVHYKPVSGLLPPGGASIAVRFERAQHSIPHTVRVKDYQYITPGVNIEAEAVVSDQGVGEVYSYGEHLRTPSEATMVAKIRAEEFGCRRETINAWTTSPTIRAGYLFSLQDHPKDTWNTQYLALEVRHSGDQRAYLQAGLGISLGDREAQLFYDNKVTAIPANVPYRPRRSTPKPLFFGSLNAKVDAAGSGEYAKIDAQGRYKIILPFDVSDRSEGRASSWLRMAQPHGGSNHGMHFPLHKGSEVMLSFVGGDPDRPVIMAGLPDPEHPSQITTENQTRCVLNTSGGNHIHFENKKGTERILFRNPVADTFMRLGACNDPVPPTIVDDKGEYGIRFYTSAHLTIDAAYKTTIIAPGESFAMVGGTNELVLTGISTSMTELFNHSTFLGGQLTADILGQTLICPQGWVDVISRRDRLALTSMGLSARETELSGLQDSLLQHQRDLELRMNALIADDQELVRQKNAAQARVDSLNGQLTQLGRQCDALHAQDQQLIGVHSELVRETQKIRGDIQRLEGEVFQLEKTKSTVAADIKQLSAVKTDVVAQKNSTAAVRSTS